MKKIIIGITFLFTSIFAFNYNGEWINKSDTSYNDPVKLIIKDKVVTPYIKRGVKIAKLKPKKATNIGNGLFEAWGFRDKNLVLVIKPINSYKLKVYLKKIYVSKRVIYTKSFIFINKNRIINKKIKSRFIGDWKNNDPLSAISRLKIIKRANDLIIKAWRPINGYEEFLGASKANIKGNTLYLRWKKGNILVKATIKGYNYNSVSNKYNLLKLNIKATNLSTGLTNEQIIYLKRFYNTSSQSVPSIGKPIKKHYKVGPLDINLLINSY